MVCPVPQVSPELLVDQESLADQEDQGCQETKAKRVGMGSQDRLESKESQVIFSGIINFTIYSKMETIWSMLLEYYFSILSFVQFDFISIPGLPGYGGPGPAGLPGLPG